MNKEKLGLSRSEDGILGAMGRQPPLIRKYKKQREYMEKTGLPPLVKRGSGREISSTVTIVPKSEKDPLLLRITVHMEHPSKDDIIKRIKLLRVYIKTCSEILGSKNHKISKGFGDINTFKGLIEQAKLHLGYLESEIGSKQELEYTIKIKEDIKKEYNNN